jgi:hypothetical protein
LNATNNIKIPDVNEIINTKVEQQLASQQELITKLFNAKTSDVFSAKANTEIPNVNDILAVATYAYIDANKTPNSNALYLTMWIFGFTYAYQYNSTTGKVGALVYTCLN